MSDPQNDLRRIGGAVRDRYEAQKRVLSFEEYLALFRENPGRHSRDSARYLRDCFDHFGTRKVATPWGDVRRFRLFDLPWEAEASDGRRLDHLVGQEAIQEAFYRILNNFAREGRVNRLVLLHGPNGSAKSTFAACIMKALEVYSAHAEGALYRFSWIFPRGKDGKTIGFGSADDALGSGETFAHLPEGLIDVKMPSELREDPLLLLPLVERRRLVEAAYREKAVTDSPPDLLWNGELGQKNRQILEALLQAYRGDFSRVLAHVQLERYYVSRRYRVGAVTIGPQMHVDASERQITADRSLSALPASLSALTLFEPYGELVDASGGIVEYSDLLKRPLDAWKYLLLAIETGEVSLPLSNLPLNSVLLASSNELHLNAFREHPEFNSFRGRILLVRVPYLLDYKKEQGIYDAQIAPQVGRHVSPHATYVAALWAVLTRLRRPQGDKYKNRALGRVAADLTPLEKAELYALGTTPERLSSDDAKELHTGIETIYREPEGWPIYEGLTGASPREIRTLLLDAAQHSEFTCLSPLAVLEKIEEFCGRNDYDFLKETPQRGYHDHRAFASQARTRWLDMVDDELRGSTGLVEESRYLELFDRYVTNVSFWIKNERVYNRVTGKYEDPDTELMASVEKTLDAGEDASEFRKNLISAVAGHAIDHPGEKVDYTLAFPRYVQRVKEAYFGEHKKLIEAILADVLEMLGPEPPTLEHERHVRATETIVRLKERHGYCDACARDALGELHKARYTS